MKDFGPERLHKTARAGTLKAIHAEYAKEVREFAAKELKRLPGVESVDPNLMASLVVDMANGDEWAIDVAVTAENGHVGTTVTYFLGTKRKEQLGYWAGTRLNEMVMDMKNILLRGNR